MKGLPHPLKKDRDIYRRYTTYIYSYIPKEKEKEKEITHPPSTEKVLFRGGTFRIFEFC